MEPGELHGANKMGAPAEGLGMAGGASGQILQASARRMSAGLNEKRGGKIRPRIEELHTLGVAGCGYTQKGGRHGSLGALLYGLDD